MRILGIDPGYAILGYGILDMQGNSFKLVTYGAVTTEAGEEMPLRLKSLYEELSLIIDRYQPEVVAMEELFFNKNAKTAIMVAQARGAAIVACVNKGLVCYEYTPLQIKQALVGYGRADKNQVQQMVKYILGLAEIPKPDDAADGIAVALCHGNFSQNGRKFTYREGI